MRARLALLVLVAVGCSPFPLREKPVAPAADLVLVDARENRPNHRPGYDQLIYDVLPFVPWFGVDDVTHMNESYLPAVRSAAERSGLFSGITASGDDPAKRLESPLVLRVTVKDSTSRRTDTTYLLGFAIWPLYLLGVPDEYVTAEAALSLECLDRQGNVRARGEGIDSSHGFRWVYQKPEPWVESQVVSALEGAMARALEGCAPGVEKTRR